MDLSKAFDSVSPRALLDKPEWYGIASDWFASYLNDRKQIVTGGSNALPILHGVAQGSLVLILLVLIHPLPHLYQRPPKLSSPWSTHILR